VNIFNSYCDTIKKNSEIFPQGGAKPEPDSEWSQNNNWSRRSILLDFWKQNGFEPSKDPAASQQKSQFLFF
jgi:hypothetical protein